MTDYVVGLELKVSSGANANCNRLREAILKRIWCLLLACDLTPEPLLRSASAALLKLFTIPHIEGTFNFGFRILNRCVLGVMDSVSICIV